MKNKSLIILCGLLASLFIGCEDLKFGDNFLEKPNSDDVSIDGSVCLCLCRSFYSLYQQLNREEWI